MAMVMLPVLGFIHSSREVYRDIKKRLFACMIIDIIVVVLCTLLAVSAVVAFSGQAYWQGCIRQ